jgi:uncharacterized protein
MPLGKIFKRLIGGFQQKPLDVNTSELPVAEELAPLVTEPSEISSEISEGTLLEVPSETTSEIPSEPVCENSLSSTTAPPIQTPSSIIPEPKKMINISMLQDELQSFVTGSSDVQGAALVSPDGLALASVLPGAMDEERTSAMSASMLSLGERIGRELARGTVERIVVEGEKGYGVLVGCSSDAVLLVLAGTGVKQGILFLEIKRVVTKLAPLLG